jgi:serine/threonine-protein kinase
MTRPLDASVPGMAGKAALLAASVLAAVLGGNRVALPADAGDPDIATKSYTFIKTYCYECHGVEEEVEGFKILERDILVKRPAGKKLPYVDVDNRDAPEKSLIWRKVVKEKSMPPPYADHSVYKFPSDEERAVIEAWIRAGAPFPKGDRREAVTDEAVVSSIRDHLRSLEDPSERRYQRYLTLSNLNNNVTVTDDQMRIHRAAASKLLNSLSWRKGIRVLRVIDKAQTVLNFDLRWYGWTLETWEAVIRTYPYGVVHNEDAHLREIEREVNKLSGNRLSFLRADWFVANVSRPPLYDKVLGLPVTLSELEKDKLFLDSKANFLNNEALRAGMVVSNVSQNNRLVERHETPYGAYWRSYDFRSSDLEGNIVLFPLGPKFVRHPFPDHAFVQAGGEVIFNLPNGLQAYMLVDAKDRRLDTPAPIEIVRDRTEKAGSPQIVNGLSCIACHTAGMIDFKDVLRDRSAAFGQAKLKVLKLFPTATEMAVRVEEDRGRYLASVELATGSFLRDKPKEGGAKDVGGVADFPEPVGEVARLYEKELTPEAVAAELGLPTADELRAVISSNVKLRELGLGPLLENGGLKRELWQRAVNSLFHIVAFEFGMSEV